MENSPSLDIQRQLRTFPMQLAMAMSSLNEALILWYLYDWIQTMKSHPDHYRKNFFNDRFYFRHSVKQFLIHFPHIKEEKTIRATLNRLKEEKLITVARHPDQGWSDRTAWYSTNGSVIEALFQTGQRLMEDRIRQIQGNGGSLPVDNRSSLPVDNRSPEPVVSIDTNLSTNRSYRMTDRRSPTGRVKKKAEKKPSALTVSGSSAEEMKTKARLADLKRYSDRFNEKRTVPSVEGLWKVFVTQYGYPFRGWIAKDRKQTKTFIKWCSDSGVELPSFLEWCVSHWTTLQSQLSWAKLDGTPDYGTILNLRNKIVALYEKRGNGGGQAQTKKTVYTDIKKVPKTHPLYQTIVRLIKTEGKAEI